MSLIERIRGLLVRIGTERASSRPVALVRIAVPLLLWSRFGSELAFFTRPFSPLRAALSTLFFATTTAMLVGLRARLASVLVGVTMVAIVVVRAGIEGDRAFLHHHVALLIITALVLGLTPCDRSFSLDHARALARGEEASEERGFVYGQWLLRLQLSVLYVFAAIDKTNAPFLSGVRLQHYLHYYYVGSEELECTLVPGLTAFAAIGTVALEYALGLLVWCPKTHRVLLPVGLAFHAMLYLFLPVHTFSITVAALYILVPDPDRVHAALERMLGR